MKIIPAKDDAYNRAQLERDSIILLSPEKDRKDTLKKIDSGINEVLARIATKSGSYIGINLAELKTCSPAEKARRLARIMQTIRLSRKSNTALYVNASKHEASALLRSLGASTTQSSNVKTQSF